MSNGAPPQKDKSYACRAEIPAVILQNVAIFEPLPSKKATPTISPHFSAREIMGASEKSSSHPPAITNIHPPSGWFFICGHSPVFFAYA